MKKVLFSFAAALLLVAACADVNVIETAAPQQLGFRAVTSRVTKGSEFTPGANASLSEGAKIYLAASYAGMDGRIWEPNFLSKPVVGGAYALGYSGAAGCHLRVNADGSANLWQNGSQVSVYYPSNGQLDFLACSIMDGDTSVEGAWYDKASFTNINDSAGRLQVSDIDAIGNQADFMYAISNGNNAVRNNGVVNLNFNHAQALLIFTAKFPDSLNIVEESGSFIAKPDVFIDDVCFWDETKDFSTLYNISSGVIANVPADNITLANRGSFTVDNSRKTPKVEWTGVKVDKSANPSFNGNMFKPATSWDLSRELGDKVVKYSVGPINIGSSRTPLPVFQLFDTVLVPEQQMQNFMVFYHVTGEQPYTHCYIFNGPRSGYWKMGYKYIYEIEVGSTKKISVKVSETEWEKGATD